MSKGLFGSMFDFNRDGNMSAFERAAEFAFLNGLMKEETVDSNLNDEIEEDIEACENRLSELEMEGLDIDELEFMDEYDRREAIENAGLDPDDYDFD